MGKKTCIQTVDGKLTFWWILNGKAEDERWIELAQGYDHLQAFVLTVFKTVFCYKRECYLFSWYTYFPNKDHRCMKFKHSKDIQEPHRAYTEIIFDK